jgi:hypothetical protein
LHCPELGLLVCPLLLLLVGLVLLCRRLPCHPCPSCLCLLLLFNLFIGLIKAVLSCCLLAFLIFHVGPAASLPCSSSRCCAKWLLVSRYLMPGPGWLFVMLLQRLQLGPALVLGSAVLARG